MQTMTVSVELEDEVLAGFDAWRQDGQRLSRSQALTQMLNQVFTPEALEPSDSSPEQGHPSDGSSPAAGDQTTEASPAESAPDPGTAHTEPDLSQSHGDNEPFDASLGLRADGELVSVEGPAKAKPVRARK